MLQSWRWFGPKDPISLTKIRPGYPWLGRLKALAELRGMLHAIEQLT